MDSQQPYGKEDLMKIIDKYLKKIGKIPKYNQQSDEYSKKISEIIENLNRFELKYRLRDHVKDLKELLNEILEDLKEKSRYLNLDIKNRYYIIFAKSFKERIKEDNLYLFDLKDLENMIYRI